MNDLSRRSFVASGLAACACALCPAVTAIAADLAPVDVGTAADFAKDGAFDKWAASGFFLIRKGKRLFAASSTCTHKNVQIVYKGGALKCPKHGSIFDLEGVVTKSPAKRPLDRLGITLAADGKITVDPSKRFDKDHWSDEGSFVELPT